MQAGLMLFNKIFTFLFYPLINHKSISLNTPRG